MAIILYIFSLLAITAFTWGFVESNVPLFHIAFLRTLVFEQRSVAAIIYVSMFVLLWIWYVYILRSIRAKRIHADTVRRFLLSTAAVLFISYPAFSNDMYNYIATARVTFLYRENPYLVMPIDIPNEPMLSFMHAANKTALYGPAWIGMTAVPFVLGAGNLVLTLYAFKLLPLVWYLLLFVQIRRSTGSVFWASVFAFNPLVITETLISAHNDVVMMSFAVFSLWNLQEKRYVRSFVQFVLSVFTKGATLFLLPVIVYVLQKGETKANNQRKIWTLSAIAMYAIFFLSPLREEMYSWYFIWPLTFVALRNKWDWLTVLSLGFTAALPMRFLPFVLTREWGGSTPTAKIAVTVLIPAGVLIAYWVYRKLNHTHA